MLKGDNGLFRGALLLAGFLPASERSIFNDNHKDGTRRLKLWYAGDIRGEANEPILMHYLSQAFGDRITHIGYLEQRWGRSDIALCVHLKD